LGQPSCMRLWVVHPVIFPFLLSLALGVTVIHIFTNIYIYIYIYKDIEKHVSPIGMIRALGLRLDTQWIPDGGHSP
jgi:hypothetical protein